MTPALTKAEREARERAEAYFTSKAALPPAEVCAQVAAAFDSLDAVLAAVAPIVMVVNVPGGEPLHWVQDIEWKAYTLVSWRLHTIDHLKQIKKGLAAGG